MKVLGSHQKVESQRVNSVMGRSKQSGPVGIHGKTCDGIVPIDDNLDVSQGTYRNMGAM